VVKHIRQEVKEYRGRFASNALLVVEQPSSVKMRRSHVRNSADFWPKCKIVKSDLSEQNLQNKCRNIHKSLPKDQKSNWLTPSPPIDGGSI
jgi:hypothetical protein